MAESSSRGDRTGSEAEQRYIGLLKFQQYVEKHRRNSFDKCSHIPNVASGWLEGGGSAVAVRFTRCRRCCCCWIEGSQHLLLPGQNCLRTICFLIISISAVNYIQRRVRASAAPLDGGRRGLRQQGRREGSRPKYGGTRDECELRAASVEVRSVIWSLMRRLVGLQVNLWNIRILENLFTEFRKTESRFIGLQVNSSNSNS